MGFGKPKFPTTITQSTVLADLVGVLVRCWLPNWERWSMFYFCCISIVTQNLHIKCCKWLHWMRRQTRLRFSVHCQKLRTLSECSTSHEIDRQKIPYLRRSKNLSQVHEFSQRQSTRSTTRTVDNVNHNCIVFQVILCSKLLIWRHN